MIKMNEIPVDWELNLLDKITQRGSGHTPDKAFEKYYNGGIKWVSLADSNRLDNGLISETSYEISELGIKKSSAVLHPCGTVLMSRDAGVGKSGIMGVDMAVSQHFIVWRCINNIIDNWYLYYWLQYKKEFFERQAVGSTIKTIGLPLFKKLTIMHPNFSEQKAVSQFLRLMDEAININNQLIRSKEVRKKWLLQNLMTGRKRLKGFKEEWKKLKLSEFSINRNSSLSINNLVGNSGPYPLYGANRIIQKIDFYECADEYISIIKDGAGVGRVFLCEGKSSIVGTMAYIKSNEKSTLHFLFFTLQMLKFENFITGSTIPHIYYSNFSKTTFKIPPLKEQTAITQILQAADKEIQLLKTKTEKLRERKKGMMQVLLTGKVRLKI
jgi:type I restriction enzyme, S subunit